MELNLIKGIGPKTKRALENLNISSVEDLLSYYPYDYLVLEKTKLDKNNTKVVIDGIIETMPQIFFFSKNKNRLTFKIMAQNLLLNVTIFNRGFLKNNLTIGTNVIIIGEYDYHKSSIVASDIRFGKLPNTPIVEPKYHATKAIKSKEIHKIINNALSYKNMVKPIIPEYFQNKYHLPDQTFSIQEIHNPTTMINLNKAINYFKYEEFLLFSLKMNLLRKQNNQLQGIARNIPKDALTDIYKRLPFQLTDDQLSAVNTIQEELIGSKRMNRLIQGDVGSGKTIVAFLALYLNYISGYQGALMAPTEVLAYQHYQNIIKLFPDLKIQLLTGSLKQKEKKQILKDLADGNTNIIIGTHALISEQVNYHKLGLVITDEQHRFGVNQRLQLSNKGQTPDVLYLSATPIPRTYALTIYGDMDISSIKTVPNGRKNIKTAIYKNDQIKDVLNIMLEQLKQNHQIYVIAPLIENDDDNGLDSVMSLKEKMAKAFNKVCKIEVMHGKMSSEEKDNIMASFKNNNIQILISTTVIEVGVDVANATTIVIFDSYKFGLSQLHQLRGRVGRNSLDNYCLLISDYDKERLNIMATTTDGFKISEEDFKMRGSGDLFGIRQSGDMSFKLANITRDFSILKCAMKDSKEILENEEYNSTVKEIIDNFNIVG